QRFRTQERLTRLFILVGLGLFLATIPWLLQRVDRVQVPPLDSTVWPAWMRQAEPAATAASEIPPPWMPPADDPVPALDAQLAQAVAELKLQQVEIDALKQRLGGGAACVGGTAGAPQAPEKGQP